MSKKITLLSRASTPVPLIVLFTLMVFFVGLMGYMAQQELDAPVGSVVTEAPDMEKPEQQSSL